MTISALDAITVIPAQPRSVFRGNQPFVYSGTGVVHIDTDVSQKKAKKKGDTGLACLPQRAAMRQKPHTALGTIKTEGLQLKW